MLMLMQLDPLQPQHPEKPTRQRQQHQIQKDQFAVHDAPAPFLPGTSFRGTTPLTVRRTPIVLFFGFALVTRSSFEAISSGRAASPTSMLTS